MLSKFEIIIDREILKLSQAPEPIKFSRTLLLQTLRSIRKHKSNKFKKLPFCFLSFKIESKAAVPIFFIPKSPYIIQSFFGKKTSIDSFIQGFHFKINRSDFAVVFSNKKVEIQVWEYSDMMRHFPTSKIEMSIRPRTDFKSFTVKLQKLINEQTALYIVES